MDKFTNLESFAEPTTTLFAQEIDVITQVVDNILTSFEAYPQKGTFILDGQAKDHDAQCILRFDLAAGISRRIFFRTYDRTSSEIAADSINNALSWPKDSRYEFIEDRALHFGWLPSGIYRDGELEVLVLNTTHGRFLASFCAEFDAHLSNGKETTSVLMAIASAIAHMGKEDKVLQQSAECVTKEASYFERNALWLVESMFESCASPVMKAWEKWHELANNSGELTLFFE